MCTITSTRTELLRTVISVSIGGILSDSIEILFNVVEGWEQESHPQYCNCKQCTYDVQSDSRIVKGVLY